MNKIKIEKIDPSYTYIYTLSDKTGIRYVGKSNNPKKRYLSHITDTRNDTYKNNWIKSLQKKKLLPILEILDIVSLDEWQFWEKYWIAQCKIWGFKLTNSTVGGDGIGFGKPYVGRKLSEETKKKLSIANTGKKLSKETKEKIRKTSLGRKHTDEAKYKCSLINKGKKLTDEHKEKLSKAKIGKKLTEEHKKKISDSTKGVNSVCYGKKASEETRKKQSLVRTGKKMSEKAKASMKLAQIERRLREKEESDLLKKIINI